jgi:hypothetical protein
MERLLRRNTRHRWEVVDEGSVGVQVAPCGRWLGRERDREARRTCARGTSRATVGLRSTARDGAAVLREQAMRTTFDATRADL